MDPARTPPLQPRRGLYAISSETADTPALCDWAEAVVSGGAVWLQYRDKSADQDRRETQAAALSALCRRLDARFIVNDDVDLALACAADGVHLGEDDVAFGTARARLPATIAVGVSCYNDARRAEQLAGAGADYLAFGAFHASGNKPQARVADIALLAGARHLGKPLVAIGGITPDNGGRLIAAGADLLAVIGGLTGPPEQAHAAAGRYAALFAATTPH